MPQFTVMKLYSHLKCIEDDYLIVFRRLENQLVLVHFQPFRLIMIFLTASLSNLTDILQPKTKTQYFAQTCGKMHSQQIKQCMGKYTGQLGLSWEEIV